MADLIERLQTSGTEFGFFQAIGLLEEYYCKKYKDSKPIHSGRIRFAADPSITFPSSDISAISVDKNVVRMLMSFMGLVGVSSPLPNYFSDYLVRYPESASALAGFCAIFNNRIYALFYEAFRKYRFTHTVHDGAALKKFAAFAGNSNAMAGYRLLAYAGMLSTRRRSAQGIAALLSDFFGDITVHIQQYMPRRVPLPKPTVLNGMSALGINVIVGTEVVDISGKFRVVVGPLHREKFESFLEGTENHATLKALIASFVTDPLAFDIEIKLASSDLIPVKLGSDNARLGQTSSLGENKVGAKGEETSVVTCGRE